MDLLFNCLKAILLRKNKEILITSLLDKNIFKYEIFKDLYHLRWGGEENYKFHKVRVEIENFSGKTPHAIEQDFHATVFTGNIRALLAEEAQSEEEHTYKEKYKYDYKINKNISISILKDEIVEALYDPERDLEAFCEQMKKSMKKALYRYDLKENLHILEKPLGSTL